MKNIKTRTTVLRLRWSFSFLLIFATCFLAVAQDKLNVEKLGQLPYTTGLNDIWGYADSLGNEYALVGLENGLSVVDVTDPSNPLEKFTVPGPNTIWRDVKTWSHYAYYVHDIVSKDSQGISIVDLDSLDTPTFKHINLLVDLDTIVDTLKSAHNIYIDENGVCYLFGSNIAKGGALMFDVATDPWNPKYLGIYNDHYLHDGMVRGDTLWGAAIYFGSFVAVDVSVKKFPQILGSAFTPSVFTHNCWISDNGKTLFTTDERTNAMVASFDVSDLPKVEEYDRIQRLPGTNVIPHNVHVKGDFLITSYYTTGVQIVNAKYPDLLVEVGFYDTFQQNNADNYRGNWGAYPYLPSGVILASDRDNGLFILQPNYVDATYLEGLVLDSLSGKIINNATIVFTNTKDTLFSDVVGVFKTGMNYEGWDTLTVMKDGYQTRKVAVYLERGVYLKKKIKLIRPGFNGSELNGTNKFIIYPNPANNYFKIGWPDNLVAENAEIQVFDVAGRLLFSKNILIDPEDVYDAPEKSGVYFVRVIVGDRVLEVERLLVY